MSVTFHLDNDVGYLELDQPDSKVNLLTADTIKQLDAALDQIRKLSSLKVLIILSKKPDVFIAGADIKEIEKITDPKDGESKAKAGQDVLNKLEDLAVPTIAVIDGVALGGGCEFALACLYRVSTFNEKVKIGLPEVNLGFVPGFGGTYRLPRTIGLSEGLKMILSGQPVDGSKALRIGLVDKLFSQKGLMDSVRKFAAEIVSRKTKKIRYARKKKKGFAHILDEYLTGNWIVFNQSRKSVMKMTCGFYPAPLKAINVIKQNFYCDRRKGLALEARAFGELSVTPISKNLVQIFYLSEKYKKLKIEGAEDVSIKTIDHCAVLGAGIMGGGIAQLLSSRGIWTRIKDINYDAIAKGFQAAAKIYRQAVERRRFTKAEAEEKMAHISGTLDYSGFGHVDMVIEAVVENMDVKKKVFQELSGVTPENAVLATNTSALSVTEMAKGIKNPARVIGFHFFNPVHRMPLVEVITTPMTSKETIVMTLNLVKRLGKTPILVRDSCGFVVNRILLGYINEAGRLLEESGDLERIDKLAVHFGLPMGPFALSDEVGLDVGLKVLHILEESFGERFKAVEIFEKVFKKGLLGKKSGKGFYIHQKSRQANPVILDLLSEYNPGRFNKEDYRDRMIYIMINEAARCLEDKIVDDPGAVDIGMIMGTGFPAFRGGLLRYADSLGIPQVVMRLEQFSRKLNAERFKPCPYLVNLRDQNKSIFNP